MDVKPFYVMGTGSRSLVLRPDRKEIYEHTEQFILEMRKYTPNIHLISGMAEGFDEVIAKVGMRNNIPYTCAIPNPTYGEYYWRDNSALKRDRYSTFSQLIECANEVVYVCPSIYVNGLHSNFVRNQWMVDHSSFALVFDPTSRGTRDAVARIELKTPKLPFLQYPFPVKIPIQESLI